MPWACRGCRPRVQFLDGSGSAIHNIHIGREFDSSGVVPRLGAPLELRQRAQAAGVPAPDMRLRYGNVIETLKEQEVGLRWKNRS